RPGAVVVRAAAEAARNARAVHLADVLLPVAAVLRSVDLHHPAVGEVLRRTADVAHAVAGVAVVAAPERCAAARHAPVGVGAAAAARLITAAEGAGERAAARGQAH